MMPTYSSIFRAESSTTSPRSQKPQWPGLPAPEPVKRMKQAAVKFTQQQQLFLVQQDTTVNSLNAYDAMIIANTLF